MNAKYHVTIDMLGLETLSTIIEAGSERAAQIKGMEQFEQLNDMIRCGSIGERLKYYSPKARKL